MTHRTITLPHVTAALLAHGVTDWSTHDYRGSVEVGDRGIIVAGKGPVRSEDVPEGWFYDDDGHDPGIVGNHNVPIDMYYQYPVHFRAAVAVGTVADVVPIVEGLSHPTAVAWVSRCRLHHLYHRTRGDHGIVEFSISHLLPFADWSPTTASGKQRWAVRWEDMRVLEPAVEWFVSDIPPEGGSIWLSVPLHRGWREADAGLIEACGEVSDGA